MVYGQLACSFQVNSCSRVLLSVRLRYMVLGLGTAGMSLYSEFCMVHMNFRL